MERYILVDTLRQYPFELKNYPEAQDDTELVQLAVKKSGLALAYASPRLRDDYETVMIAVQKTGMSLEFASAQLQNNRDIIYAAIRDDGRAMEFVPAALRQDRQLVLEAVANQCYLELIPDEFLTDKEIILHLLEHYDAYARIPDEIADDIDIILTALKNAGDHTGILMSIPDEVLKDREKMLQILEIDGYAMDYAVDTLKEDKELALVSLESATREYDKQICADELPFFVPEFSIKLWEDPDIKEKLAPYYSYTEDLTISIPPAIQAHIDAENFSYDEFAESVEFELNENGIEYNYVEVFDAQIYISEILCGIDNAADEIVLGFHLDEDSAWEELIKNLNDEFGDPT